MAERREEGDVTRCVAGVVAPINVDNAREGRKDLGGKGMGGIGATGEEGGKEANVIRCEWI